MIDSESGITADIPGALVAEKRYMSPGRVQKAARRGAEVTVIAANVGLAQPDGVRWIPVTTAAELAEAAHAEFASCDVLVMAAAVSRRMPWGSLISGAAGITRSVL